MGNNLKEFINVFIIPPSHLLSIFHCSPYSITKQVLGKEYKYKYSEPQQSYTALFKAHSNRARMTQSNAP